MIGFLMRQVDFQSKLMNFKEILRYGWHPRLKLVWSKKCLKTKCLTTFNAYNGSESIMML